jgi:hypothetical protein
MQGVIPHLCRLTAPYRPFPEVTYSAAWALANIMHALSNTDRLAVHLTRVALSQYSSFTLQFLDTVPPLPKLLSFHLYRYAVFDKNTVQNKLCTI